MGVEIIVATIIVVVLGAVAFKVWMKKQIMIRAGQLTSEMYAVWAAQGPFENGGSSAIAMRYAHAAVRGPESIKDVGEAEAFTKHAAAYNADPQCWESLRQKSLSGANGQKFEDQLTIAKGFAAMDDLNSGIFKDAGLKMGFGKDANGNTTMVCNDPESKYLLTEDEVDLRFKNFGDSIEDAVGKKLLDDKSEEAQELVNLLIEAYKICSDRNPETPGDFGKIWNFLSHYSADKPDEEISRAFTDINARWQAIKSELK